MLSLKVQTWSLSDSRAALLCLRSAFSTVWLHCHFIQTPSFTGYFFSSPEFWTFFADIFWVFWVLGLWIFNVTPLPHPLPGTFLLPSCYLLRSDRNFQATLFKLAVHWNHLGNLTLRGYGPGGLRTQCGRICISNKLPDDSETVSLWAHFDEYTFKVQFKTPVFQEI